MHQAVAFCFASVCLLALVVACGEGASPDPSSSPGGTVFTEVEPAGTGGFTTAPLEPTPRYHPPEGFEDCIHVEVIEDCTDGWCKLPPSCFVMGSPEDEWRRGMYTEDRVAVTLSNTIEVQQTEFTRSNWQEIVGEAAPDVEGCMEDDCPAANVSWWDALHVANLLSAQKGLTPCYEPIGCTGTLGKDLVCTGVADPDAPVYACEGYRLMTRAEAEYAARAGTISTFYSGDITPYPSAGDCNQDSALELIAWYCHNSDDRAHRVAQLQANGFGLYDMIGNLGEWLNEQQHYSSSPGGTDPRGAVETGASRFIFAPQYDGMAILARTASLLSAPRDTRGATTGFRLARSIHE